ncbi:2330_t:CDS:2 [Cetraspora pellucida]|uniref:2330_t:CDS:1 n=1 Tax=Cetraspora pellucida TaxID=1433469 RepID=A0A9N8W2V7_9GLOM|nr:2330_t:CDS:2 [Cetraspora pellucida]
MNSVRLLALTLPIITILLIFVNATPAYLPGERSGHTACLVDSKLYFLGGKNKYGQLTNDFFYLDVSKPFLISNFTFLPFHDLSYLSSILPPHQRGTASLCDMSIYFFGGERDHSTKQISLIYAFNAVTQQWSHPKIKGNEPNIRKQLASTCDSKGQMYLYAGLNDIDMGSPLKIYNNIDILDTVNLIWNTSTENVFALSPEFNNGFSATMLENGIIVYIGGWNNDGYHDMSKIMLYNTNTASWSFMKANGQIPGKRAMHTSVLTKDDRILIWGGENGGLPAEPQLAVLDTQFRWSIPDVTGVKNSIESLPYYAHTASMIDDYMIIAFGLTYDNLHNLEIPSNLIFLLYTPNKYHYEWISVFIPSILPDNASAYFDLPEAPPPISPDDPIDRPIIATDILIVIILLVGAIIGFAGWHLYKYYTENRGRAGYSLLPTNDFWTNGFWDGE